MRKLKSLKRNPFIGLLISLAVCSGCRAQQSVSEKVPSSDAVVAFPGAEGFGKFTTGGRGGAVMLVTNLNDRGPGSFRAAAEAKGKRIIVFRVSGTIHLEKKLHIRGDVTIAGQTAPGDGICVADESVVLEGDNIIVRYLRFRMGDRFQKGGMVDGNGGDDAFGGTRRKNIIVDHCSMSWSTDEAFSVYAGDSTTLQWNLIAEPLNYSYHFESGDTGYEHHGYGAIWGGRHFTAHHNLFAHCNNRNPRFDGIRNAPEENCDYRNNVIYDWGSNTIYAGEGGHYNIVNNYFKYGPSTRPSARYRIVNPGRRVPDIPFGKWYVSGNFVYADPRMSADNERGVVMGNGGTAADKKETVVATPWPFMQIPTESAEKAFQSVLAGAGASFRRDTLDQRIAQDVLQGTGRLIDVQGGFPHGTPYEETLKAWPYLASLPAPVDTDQDGIPDDWEKAHGLNSADGSDAIGHQLDPSYCNIEVYINSLVHP